MKLRLIILSNDTLMDRLLRIAESQKEISEIVPAYKLEELISAGNAGWHDVFLLSFGTGVIVPKNILEQLGTRAINIHPATRQFPGRDPHHFAAYENVVEYGATAHRMTERVDAGEILIESRVSVETELSPDKLLEIAEGCGIDLFQRLIEIVFDSDHELPRSGLHWEGKKRTRKDFQALCRVNQLMDNEELLRRERACAHPDFDNLSIELGQRQYKLVPSKDVNPSSDDEKWKDFTESAYEALIEQAKSENYKFSLFQDRPAERHVLWRHDVDYSLQRAMRLAQIERVQGVCATYFVCLRLPFYNLLESESARIVREIESMGHGIGLHFDSGFYDDDWDQERLDERISNEKHVIESNLGVTLSAVSFHDPTAGNMMRFDENSLGGLKNAYGKEFRQNYGYCSDSNGYWRHDPIYDVIASGEFERLQVLTHPAWWLPEALPPKQRIERAVLGRARAVMREYDEHLETSGRRNIG
ncbi:MAG: formyltransferase family protein [Parvibaculaceae bacterium]|nr:formyltransferase family protein [Parvibaculaceae bacterium]HBM89901.1 hypothetical protein [Rhodobiaceae bacterium]|tara:strand:+ start:5922 stop:7343 length:1422 start_codon:yes stop_codon:yes gene_type:complete